MVDWNLDDVVAVKNDTPIRPKRRPNSSIQRGPFGAKKSKPLSTNHNQHIRHSGKKRQSQITVKVKKAKRDSFGNVVSSR